MVDDELSIARAVRRFDSTDKASGLDLRDPLLRTLHALDHNEFEDQPVQVLVVVATRDSVRDKSGVRYFTAGSLDTWGIMGMFDHAASVIRNTAGD